jgi:multicomponent Na+:H+ antiporter subunit D
VVIAGGLFGAMYLFKVLGLAFTSGTVDTGQGNKQPREHVSGVMTAVAMILAIITLALGFNAEFILNISNPIVEASSV